MVPFNWR